MRHAIRLIYGLLAAGCLACVAPSHALAQDGAIGVVVMHGKGGLPSLHVSQLASALSGEGFQVANLEMPWSKNRNYDALLEAGNDQITAAFKEMRAKGAKKVFVAGHSQGGLFALQYGGRFPVDGVIAIAPGGAMESTTYKDKLGEFVEQASRLVAEGKADETTRLSDYEQSKGAYPLVTTPAIYLSWFDPEGGQNLTKATRAIKPSLPVLYIVAAKETPGLRKYVLSRFENLPANPLTRLYEPAATHYEAPTASIDEITRWIKEVAAR